MVKITKTITKKTYPRRRRQFRKRRSKIMRPMRMQIYKFKRTFEEFATISAAETSWVSNDNGLYKQFVYQLTDVPGYTDFTNLFHMYKLTGASVKMYFSNTGSEITQDQQFSNSQLLMRIAPNNSGAAANPVTRPLNQQWFNETQSTKKRLCLNSMGKPLVTYTKLKQLSEVYHSAIDNDYTIKVPTWISTTEVSTPHYGLNCRLDRVDGEALTTGFTNAQKIRIMTTLYISCKQVG